MVEAALIILVPIGASFMAVSPAVVCGTFGGDFYPEPSFSFFGLMTSFLPACFPRPPEHRHKLRAAVETHGTLAKPAPVAVMPVGATPDGMGIEHARTRAMSSPQ